MRIVKDKNTGKAYILLRKEEILSTTVEHLTIGEVQRDQKDNGEVIIPVGIVLAKQVIEGE